VDAFVLDYNTYAVLSRRVREFKMKISIALCTYNGENYLSDQLASYLKQTRLPDELVIYDDRSTDHTLEIVEQFSAQAPFPVHLHVNESNLGSTKNFEGAFQRCQGEIIVPSDQDDVWNERKLERLAVIFDEHPQVGLVFTDADVVDGNLESLDYTLWQSIKFTPAEQKRVQEGDVISVLLKHNVVTGATMAFRADLKSLFMPIPELWVHDAWITFWIALVAGVMPVPDPLIRYRRHGRNQVGTPGTMLRSEIDYALNQSQDLKNHIYEKYSILRERVERQFPDKKAVLKQLDRQIMHRQTRSQLPHNPLCRLPIVLRELLTRRYHLYSSGYRSAARDLLLMN